MKTLKENVLIKSALGTVILMLLYYLVSLFFGLPKEQGFEIWSFIANYLVVTILGFFIIHSIYQGLKLSLIVFIIYFFIGHFNILIEAYIFNITDKAETALELFRGLLVTLVFSPIYVFMFNNKEISEMPMYKSKTFISWTWRVLLGNVLYLVFYITAGMILTITYPKIMQFYEGKIPPFELIIKTQLFLRGFIFVAIAILMLRTLNLSLLKKAILIGLTFSILGGIAPLMSPNELMPDYVRLGHGFEVGISNFFYGLTLGFLLGQKTIPRKTDIYN